MESQYEKTAVAIENDYRRMGDLQWYTSKLCKAHTTLDIHTLHTCSAPELRLHRAEMICPFPNCPTSLYDTSRLLAVHVISRFFSSSNRQNMVAYLRECVISFEDIHKTSWHFRKTAKRRVCVFLCMCRT